MILPIRPREKYPPKNVCQMNSFMNIHSESELSIV
jgi:hypothetical protein